MPHRDVVRIPAPAYRPWHGVGAGGADDAEPTMRSAIVEITRLALPQQLIEIDFTAVVPDQPTIRLSSRT
jgi:hypothetical protein